LVHYGYADDDTYAGLLRSADAVLSTAIHEFFGVSVVEAVYCGAHPVLPRRLSYGELVPAALHGECLYDNFDGLLGRLRAVLRARPRLPELQRHVARFDWSVQAPAYDAEMEGLAR